MSEIIAWLLIGLLSFIAIQIFKCGYYLQKIYRIQIEDFELQKQIRFTLTQQINFFHSLEGPLHRFLDKK